MVEIKEKGEVEIIDKRAKQDRVLGTGRYK